MPTIKWEWNFGPQVVVSLLNFAAIALTAMGIWFQMRSDVSAARDTITELKTIVATLRESQAAERERVTRVETKVDLMLPAISRIEARQIQLAPAVPLRGSP